MILTLAVSKNHSNTKLLNFFIKSKSNTVATGYNEV